MASSDDYEEKWKKTCVVNKFKFLNGAFGKPFSSPSYDVASEEVEVEVKLTLNQFKTLKDCIKKGRMKAIDKGDSKMLVHLMIDMLLIKKHF